MSPRGVSRLLQYLPLSTRATHAPAALRGKMDSPATRVFKKSSPNGKLTVYLEKRDFVDHFDHVDPVDGILLVDPGSLQGKKAYVTLMCIFRGGREDLDVLGLSFRKDLYTHTVQVCPPPPEERRPLSPLQERLQKKLGPHAHPFCFTIPNDLPCSMGLQLGPEDSDQSYGVDYELRAFYGQKPEEETPQRHLVHLVIRKVQYAPENPGPRLVVEASRSFLLSERMLHVEASLDRELYYHGEPIGINVFITNGSSKTVKKVKISVWQCADICLPTSAQFKCQVAQLEADHLVSPNSTASQVFTLTPSLSANRKKRGLALDGKYKDQDTNLASSSRVREGCAKDAMGIVVSYCIKVRLVVSFEGDVTVELPFTLMHPKPATQLESQPAEAAGGTAAAAGPVAASLLDTDLINLELLSTSQTDDFVFEDFARKQLEGPDATTDKKKEEDPPLF